MTGEEKHIGHHLFITPDSFRPLPRRERREKGGRDEADEDGNG